MNAEPTPTLSPTARLLKVITEPGVAFESTAARPFPWLVILIGVALLVLSSFLVRDVSLEFARETTIKSMVEHGMDAAEAERAFAQSAGFQRVGVWLGPLIGAPIVMAVVALIYWVAGNAIYGERAHYFALLEMVGVAGLVRAIGALLKAPLVLSSQDPFASLGLGAFVDSASAAYPFLAAVDPFSVWALCLVAIGLSRIYKVPVQRSAFLAAVMWLMGILMAGIPALLFGGMGR